MPALGCDYDNFIPPSTTVYTLIALFRISLCMTTIATSPDNECSII